MGKKSDRARVFWSGRSQAVRLPRAYRIDTAHVRIWREGTRVVLEPVEETGWPETFFEVFGEVDDTFDLGERDRTPERSV